MLDFLPDELKRQVLDRLANGVAGWAEQHGRNDLAKAARKLTAEGPLLVALDRATKQALDRFQSYDDPPLVAAINDDPGAWVLPSSLAALVQELATGTATLMCGGTCRHKTGVKA